MSPDSQRHVRELPAAWSRGERPAGAPVSVGDALTAIIIIIGRSCVSVDGFLVIALIKGAGWLSPKASQRLAA